MSRNAIEACAAAQLPLVALTRPPWQAQPGDRWTHVPDMDSAVSQLDCAPMRIFLGVGRLQLPLFEAVPQHHFLLRLVDAPKTPLAFPSHEVILARGPFYENEDRVLLKTNLIDLVVSKNSGGSGAVAKIDAARQLGLPVLMIDRPSIPARTEVHDVDSVLTWLTHHGADLGV